MSRKTIMSSSPLDSNSPGQGPPQNLVQIAYSPPKRWVPSRFNARTLGDDGRLILWNTLSGSVTVFAAKDADRVVALLNRQSRGATPTPTATYLHDRGYLIPEGFDEMAKFRYLYAQQQWRQDSLGLILMASEDCNFRCVYCYEKFKRGTMEPSVRQGVRELIMKRAPKLDELSISWFGGEPLYGWEAIEELEPFLNDVTQRHGIRFSQHMTTNAYLLDEQKASKLLEWGVRHYQITIDGLPGEHDCKRIGRDGSPTYHVILDNLRSMRDRRDESFTIIIRVNFDRLNLPNLGPFIEAMSEEFSGDDRFEMSFHAVGQWGGDGDADLEVCGLKESRLGERQMRNTAAQLGLGVGGGIAAPAGSQVCYAARPYHFVVGASGTLMKCTVALDELEDNIVGHLYPSGEMDINEERMGKWVGPHFEQDSLCQQCYVLPGCQGAACPLTRINAGTRTCCSTKSSLKDQMRHTLESKKGRKVTVVPAAES